MTRKKTAVQKRNARKSRVVRNAETEGGVATEHDETMEDVGEDDEEESPATVARNQRTEALRNEATKRSEAAINLGPKDAEDEDDEDGPLETGEDGAPLSEKNVTFLDGKPGSGAGLKPGDRFAPRSNPGAAARVPTQPLSPDSLQSHGKGLLHDKDLDNGAFAGDVDPALVDAAPSGSHPDVIDKDAEVEKAERMTARAKQLDPDNPARGRKGKDATASPKPIGSRHTSKNSLAGGSNSGVDDD